jgi:hypothetical protein
MFPDPDITLHNPRQLAPSPESAGLAKEWETYRQEVGTLLAQGLEGQFVLIKGDQIIGLFDSWEAARTAGLRFFLLQPFLVRPISRRDLRMQKTFRERARRRVRSHETIPAVLRQRGNTRVAELTYPILVSGMRCTRATQYSGVAVHASYPALKDRAKRKKPRERG